MKDKFLVGSMQTISPLLMPFNDTLTIKFNQDKVTYDSVCKAVVLTADTFDIIGDKVVIYNGKKKVAMFRLEDVQEIY